MKLSACIITKNEKDNLERCLHQLSGYGFELLVVDTGSTDGTVEMACHYTSAIRHFTWCDDFSKAKNYAIAEASNDQVLVIDSDEFLLEIDLNGVEKGLKEHPKQVGRIQRINQIFQGQEITESTGYVNRLFDRRYFRYEGKIHEQIVSYDGKPYETYRVPITVEHTGYLLTEENRKKKAMRNIKLLQRVLDTDGPDSYILYQLGKGYYLMKEYVSACRYFEQAIEFELNPVLEYVIDLVECYGYSLLNTGQVEKALEFANIYDEFGSSADFQFLMGLIYMNNKRFDDAILEFQKAATQRESKVKGINSYLAYYNIGVIQECLGRTAEALNSYSKCGDYQSALNRIQQLISKSEENV